jgi:hypothetical protein
LALAVVLLFIPPLALAATDGSDDGARAREVPVLEYLSWRVVGPAALLLDEVAAAALEAPAADDPSPEPLPGTDVGHVVATATDNAGYGLDALMYPAGDTNDTFDHLRPHQPTLPFEVYPGSSRGYTTTDSASRWSYRGTLGGGLGSATFADNDYWEFELWEIYDAANGDTYEFYQGIEHNNSYYESCLLRVGARQRLRDWLWDGDLRLREEFRLYTDLDNDLNDRQEGRFELCFDPQWDSGRWEADLEYKYRVRTYETFSTRSYRYNAIRTAVERTLSPELATAVRLRYENYDYSMGSTRSNNRTALANEWEWEAQPGLKFNAGVESEEKDYSGDATRSYDKLTYGAGVDWDIDCDSSLEIDAKFSGYTRDQEPSRDYDDQRVNLRYRRDLNEQLDIELRLAERRKEFDSAPDNDIDESGYDVRLNYNPSCAWNYYGGYAYRDYDYAMAARAFARQDTMLGVAHYRGPLRASLDLRRQAVSFNADGGRDYDRNDLLLDVAYRFAEQSWRVYYGIGKLDQAAVSSLNDYTETRLGAEWKYKLDRDVDLKLSYDYSERDYATLSDLDYSLLAAEIEFEL